MQPFEAIFGEASDAMLILDRRRQIVAANPAACLLFGLAVAELTGRILDDLLAPEATDLTGAWAALLATGTVQRRHGIAPTGQVRRAVDCTYRTLDDAGRFLCVVRETSDRRLLEARLAQSEKLDSLGRLAGGIAHDFNNLLTAILGYTELLLESRGPNADEHGDLKQIEQAGQRAAFLTQQLLAYSRKQLLTPRIVDLNYIVTELRGMLSRLIREEIAVICEPAPQPAFLHIDPTQLEQVIVTLALNARDSIAAAGTIRIVVSVVPAIEEMNPVNLRNPPHLVHPVNPANLVNPVRDTIHLRVSDNGAGISAEARTHLFEPFFSPRDVSRRTGLGLASVYGIVRQSHGFIEVESEMGTGTSFLMTFPAADMAAAIEIVSPPAQPLAALESPTILLVEDEDAVRGITSTILRRHGYRVLEASTPRAAFELFAVHADAVALLLTDVVMPEMNGPGLAQRLVAAKPALRVVFMSGHADVTSPFEVDNSNIGFLNKPFQASGLLGTVQAVLARPVVKT